MSIIVKNKNGQQFTAAGAGKDGAPGKSAYQIAVDNGFTGTEAEWLASLKGQDGADGTDGAGVPSGGAVGKFLKKKTDNDFDTEWGDVDLTADEVTGVLPVTKGGTGGTIWPSNLNLLINGDFRKPVNRNGKREYTGVGFTIDRVKIINGKVKVMDNYLEVTLNAQYSSLSFPLDCFDIGKTYTLSWLLELVTSDTVYTEIYANGLVGYNDISTQGINILTGGGVVNTKITAANLVNAGNTPVTLKVYAAKLELGDQQTLAHKDADGNWVLNDPPNYDLQYVLCNQYSPITGEFVGSQHSNPNLIDNAYWADKDYIINQRGQNEYTAYGYSIDRYQIIAATLNINNNDITVSAPDDATNSHMVYLFENIPKAQTVTLSMLVDELNGHCYMTGFGKSLTLEPGLNVLTHTIPENYQNNSLYLLNYLQGTIKLKAAKLELGPVQTLAHKDENGNWILNDPPPSPSLELLKCQRYFQVFETQSARPTKALDFRPTMRTEPALSTITVAGKTLYTASADL